MAELVFDAGAAVAGMPPGDAVVWTATMLQSASTTLLALFASQHMAQLSQAVQVVAGAAWKVTAWALGNMASSVIGVIVLIGVGAYIVYALSSTCEAWQDSQAARDDLTRLREQGPPVLNGTDVAALRARVAAGSFTGLLTPLNVAFTPMCALNQAVVVSIDEAKRKAGVAASAAAWEGLYVVAWIVVICIGFYVLAHMIVYVLRELVAVLRGTAVVEHRRATSWPGFGLVLVCSYVALVFEMLWRQFYAADGLGMYSHDARVRRQRFSAWRRQSFAELLEPWMTTALPSRVDEMTRKLKEFVASVDVASCTASQTMHGNRVLTALFGIFDKARSAQKKMRPVKIVFTVKGAEYACGLVLHTDAADARGAADSGFYLAPVVGGVTSEKGVRSCTAVLAAMTVTIDNGATETKYPPAANMPFKPDDDDGFGSDDFAPVRVSPAPAATTTANPATTDASEDATDAAAPPAAEPRESKPQTAEQQIAKLTETMAALQASLAALVAAQAAAPRAAAPPPRPLTEAEQLALYKE